MVNNEITNVKPKSGNEVKVERDFYLNELIACMEQSEGVYPGIASKFVAISTIKMLFELLDITTFIEQKDVSRADYEKWFKELAEKYGYDEIIYDVLLNDGNEDEDEK